MNNGKLNPLDLYDIRSQLAEEERMVRDAVARFVDQKALPIIAECFDKARFPTELIPEMASLGLLGATIPEEFGGAGMSQVAYGLICQELERGDSGLRSFASVQSSLVMYPIHAFGSDEQKRRYLSPMARGELIGCFGLTEAHGGSDPSNMKTQAKRDGDDWVINGAKMWITNGNLAQVALIWAKTAEGVRGFLVPTDTQGFSAQEIHRKMSLRASVTSALFFDDVRLPASAMLPHAKGLRGPLSCLDSARYGISWGPLGAAQACLKEVIDYTAEREMFGRPLAANQAIQVRLAEMARQLTLGQQLVLQLGRAKDALRAHPTQISLAKWNNVRIALDIARECRDILGGAGITTEHVAIRHALNLESVVTYEGTQTVHQLIVGRELTGINAF